MLRDCARGLTALAVAAVLIAAPQSAAASGLLVADGGFPEGVVVGRSGAAHGGVDAVMAGAGARRDPGRGLRTTEPLAFSFDGHLAHLRARKGWRRGLARARNPRS